MAVMLKNCFLGVSKASGELRCVRVTRWQFPNQTEFTAVGDFFPARPRASQSVSKSLSLLC